MNIIKFQKDLVELTISIIQNSNSAHLGSCMSIKNIIAVFFTKFYNNKNVYPLILSKGHAAAIYYSALHLVGEISFKEIISYSKNNSLFPGHVTKNNKYKSLVFSSGSLGHGLPYICGLAYSNKLKDTKKKFYVIISDGELNEGTTWESLLICSKLQLNNLIIIIDNNKYQSYDKTSNIMNLESITKKISAFGLNVKEIDGHDNKQINRALSSNSSKTLVIVANTIKGHGLGILENTLESHYINKY